MNDIDLDIQLIKTQPITFEYRVYYDDSGKVLFYTTGKPEGKYIVVTKEDYALQNSRAVVIDGKLIDKSRSAVTSLLVKNSGEGVSTSKYDVSIIESDTDSVHWKLTIYDN